MSDHRHQHNDDGSLIIIVFVLLVVFFYNFGSNDKDLYDLTYDILIKKGK